MAEHADLARLLALVADDLDHRGYRAAGVVARAARFIAQTSATTDAGCPQCGRDVEQLGLGRPRVFCTTSCRRKFHR